MAPSGIPRAPSIRDRAAAGPVGVLDLPAFVDEQLTRAEAAIQWEAA